MNRSVDNLLPNEQRVSSRSAEGPSSDYGTLITTNDAPSSYQHGPVKGRSAVHDSFSTRLRRARDHAGSPMEEFVAILTVIFGSFLWTLILVLTLAVPIAMIVIGASYLENCPAQRYIPIMLIVGGSVTVLSNMVNLVDRILREPPKPSSSDDGDDDDHEVQPLTRRVRIVAAITTLLNCLAFGWFIAGCVWVYSTQPSHDESDKKFCAPVLYYFAFWLFNTTFIFIGFLFLVGFVGMCCACFI